GQRLAREVLVEEGGEFTVEVGDGVGRQGGGHAGAGADATPPRLVAVGDVHGERERLGPSEPGFGDVEGPERVHAQSSGEGPLGIVFEDERFGGGHDVPGQWEPVEITDDERTVGHQYSPALGGSGRTIEPVPTLTGGDDIEDAVGRVDVLGPTHAKVDLDAVAGSEAPSFEEKGLGGGDPPHRGSSPCDPTGQRARAGAQVEQPLSRAADAQCRQSDEELGGKAGPVRGIVLRRLPEVDPHVASLAWIDTGAVPTRRRWSFGV